MKNDIALAMRQALDHTRAQDVWQATDIIQTALGGQSEADTDDATSAFDVPPRGARPGLIDLKAKARAPRAGLNSGSTPPDSDATSPGRAALPQMPRPRRPLGAVLSALREGQALFGPSRPLPGLKPTAPKAPPSPHIPDGAQFLSRSFTCAAGARDYKLYVPAKAANGPRTLVVMLHGCTQNPEDFAVGTNMNALAEAEGVLVAYPAQTAVDNMSSCWNWFRSGDQSRDAGEPAIIAGLTRAAVSEFGVAPDKVFVAGLSAGGAMAAVMGETYPDLYAAVGVHSGLAYGSANDVVSAFAAMRGQSTPQARAWPRAAEESAGKPRLIVFHGRADQTVHPSNADRIVAAARLAGFSGDIHSERCTADSGRGYTRSIVISPQGLRTIEYWQIDSTGHAWSGGHPRGSYTDPDGPDASTGMLRFFLHGTQEDM